MTARSEAVGALNSLVLSPQTTSGYRLPRKAYPDMAISGSSGTLLAYPQKPRQGLSGHLDGGRAVDEHLIRNPAHWPVSPALQHADYRPLPKSGEESLRRKAMLPTLVMM